MKTEKRKIPHITTVLNNYPIHYDVDPDLECFGELEEKDIWVDGIWVDTKYICSECGKEFSSHELIQPKAYDTSDSVCGSWEVE